MLQCTSMQYHLLFYSISELTLPKKKFLNFITTKVSCGFSPFFQSSKFYVYTYYFIFLDIFKIPFYHQEFLNLLWILLKFFYGFLFFLHKLFTFIILENQHPYEFSMWYSPSFWQWWRCVDGSPTVWCRWKHVGRPGSGQWRRFRPWTSAWSWSEGWWWGKWTWSSSHMTCTLPANQVHWIISDHNVKFNYLGYHLMCCFFYERFFYLFY